MLVRMRRNEQPAQSTDYNANWDCVYLKRIRDVLAGACPATFPSVIKNQPCSQANSASDERANDHSVSSTGQRLPGYSLGASFAFQRIVKRRIAYSRLTRRHRRFMCSAYLY